MPAVLTSTECFILTGLGGLSRKGLAWKDNGRRLTRLSSILMRASNSCSPSRLFCRGPKVLPAHCTDPTSWGRCFSCSSRMRFSTPPALDRADTCGKEQKAVSSHACVCVCTPTTLYTSLLLCATENGDQGRLETEISGKLSCIWFFPPRGKLLQTCRACVPISKEEVLVFLSQCQFLGRHSKG